MTPYSDSVSLRLPYSVKLAAERKSLTHYTKGTQSRIAPLPLFVCIRFQVLFHSPPGVLFAFPSRYLFTIGRQEYLVLEGGPPRFTHERPSTRYSGDQPRSLIAFGYGALTLYGLPF